MVRVIASRQHPQNKAWSDKLRAQGYAVLEAPLLEIAAVSDKKLAIANNKVLNLNEYQKLIFVSQNAVDFGVKSIDEFWPQLPMGLSWLAIGSRTSEVLLQKLKANFDETASIVSATQAMNSEELLAQPELISVADEKVLIFRGCGGRPTLADTLEQRGAKVEYCELYERLIPKASMSILHEAGLSDVDVLPVFSAEGLENFMTLVDNSRLPELKNMALIVPSTRVEKIARNYGFERLWVARNATEAQMLFAIEQALLHLT